MPDWVKTVLTSEFFWGVIVGLVLAAIGAWLQALFTARQQQKAQKRLIKNFCIDTVTNLRTIVDDMVNHRQMANVIHNDYLALLDIEFNVFGRNREHIIHLPNPVRDNVRKFINDCAVRRGEIGSYLAQFSNFMTFANQLQAQGQVHQAQQVRNQQAPIPLGKANQALDQLNNRVSADSTNLVNTLRSVR